MIMMWSGTIATIPSGWVLCNGSNSTPDLRNRFVVCADADSGGAAKSTIAGAAAQTGGSTTITTGNMPAHTHGIGSVLGSSAGANEYSPGAGATVLSTSTGSGTAYTQPFYSLAFIMKT